MKSSSLIFLALMAGAAGAPAQQSSPAAADSGLPKWLKFGGEIRGRGEMLTGIGYVPDNDDGYYLHRVRFNVSADASPWLHLFVQIQDSQAPAYRKPVPATVANTLDLRQGFILLGRPGKTAWEFRIGRQEMAFGEDRLIGAGAWGNVSRSFDAARLTWQRGGLKADVFSGAVVTPINNRFDRPRFNNKFHGLYVSSEKWIPKAAFQPYFLIKTISFTRDEGGRAGSYHVYTTGARWTGKLPRRVDYGIEVAAQTGHSGRDGIRAWAGHWQAGYTVAAGDLAPRLIAEYNFASGDKTSGDGKRGTFDQLYPTNHFFYGAADMVGWRNIHDVMAGVEWKLTRKVRLRTDYHSFWLASRQDSLYNDGGAAAVRNSGASSSHVGQEFDAWILYRLSPRLQLGAGAGRLVAGRYLKDSTRGASVTYPYIQWQYSF